MSDIFADEWRDCLQAHYTHVVRENDLKTLESLKTVMHEVGFRDRDLREMLVVATAHVDDVAEDFVPDLDILQQAEQEDAPVVEEAPQDTPIAPAAQRQLSMF
jgi:hypothetical protein